MERNKHVHLSRHETEEGFQLWIVLLFYYIVLRKNIDAVVFHIANSSPGIHDFVMV